MRHPSVERIRFENELRGFHGLTYKGYDQQTGTVTIEAWEDELKVPHEGLATFIEQLVERDRSIWPSLRAIKVTFWPAPQRSTIIISPLHKAA